MLTPPPNRSHILTEQPNPASANLDLLSIQDAVSLMNTQDAVAVAAVEAQRSAIAAAVRLVAAAFSNGGRLVTFGAGTSGRLAVLDAAECPPTFCTDPAMVVGIIAGGIPALTRSIEAVEDDAPAGAQHAKDLALSARDVALGIAAGGTTPFVHGALTQAKSQGATTIFLVCTDPAHISLAPPPDLWLPILTGPEVLTGSTRLKAGTATKLVLNTITTLAMVQIGKTYGNLMVDIDALKNAKLTDRAARIISQITTLDRPSALALLHSAGGQVKRAIVMYRKNCPAAEADRLLQAAHGNLRAIIG
jgi:N-acetylmuramic acid 6-phosphate etherase